MSAVYRRGCPSNLVQNAFKFTRAGTTVVLRVGASAERVLIEIQDECGGLPIGNVNELFRPFEQRGVDRTGLGLGLAFSRWGVEANNGRISARSCLRRDASSPSTSRRSRFPPWRSCSLEAPRREHMARDGSSSALSRGGALLDCAHRMIVSISMNQCPI